MNTGASPHLTDIRIRRLKAFQRAVKCKFSTAVDHHKADIERQSARFREKFPIIARDIRRPEENPSEPKSEAGPIDTAVEEPAPVAAETPGFQLNAGSPFKDHEKPRLEFGRNKQVRGRTRSAPVTEAPPPEDREGKDASVLERLQELEELHILRELEKFQARQQRQTHQESRGRQEQPEFIKPQEAPKNQGSHFSINRLFDLSPRFPQDASDRDQDH
ncbi:MAG: hypothetical protein K9G33_04855 [Sneathiella sp.]|nr:hypothetical protein [Sneathiella sp.]